VRAIILGCGPAGLMAAQGLQDACEVRRQPLDLRIMSLKRPSELFGAQYLHVPIPGVTRSQPVTVQYRLTGTPDAYRRKVYGPLWDGAVSPEDLATPHQAWDIRETYANLWRLWEDRIQDVRLDGAGVGMLLGQYSGEVDLFINSIPRQNLCVKQHTFGFTEIIAAGDAPARGIILKQFWTPENTVVCNGEENPSWYRRSRVFHHTTVEWPGSIARVPVTSASRVKKPLFTDCDCWPEVKHVGRYGKWEKGVLSHTAYDDAARWAREAIVVSR
jgi:hypothetical protein